MAELKEQGFQVCKSPSGRNSPTCRYSWSGNYLNYDGPFLSKPKKMIVNVTSAFDLLEYLLGEDGQTCDIDQHNNTVDISNQ